MISSRMSEQAVANQSFDAARMHTPNFWLIEPAAAPNDSRWQDRPVWRWVVVAAPSAAFARRIAENWALPSMPPQIGNESDNPRAGFLDEKLYHVRPVAPAPGWLYPLRRDVQEVLDAALLRAAPSRIEN
jgi:hypothetical protein